MSGGPDYERRGRADANIRTVPRLQTVSSRCQFERFVEVMECGCNLTGKRESQNQLLRGDNGMGPCAQDKLTR